MFDPQRIAHALAVLPDSPRWIEARAVLLSGHGAVFGAGGDLVIRNDAPGGGIAVAMGRAPEELARSVLGDRPGRELLCAAEDGEHWQRVLRGWSTKGVLLYGLQQAGGLVPPSAAVERLTLDHSLDHLPQELREEIEQALPDHAVWCAFQEGDAAAFAYSHWRTEGWFDISIDTAPAYRRRGLARRAVSELIRRELAAGLQPVWGAMASNTASQRLAASLGFVPVDRMLLLTQDTAELR